MNSDGIGVIRFDFTGLGESEGEFSDTNFSSNVDDLITVFDYMKENNTTPQIIIGNRRPLSRTQDFALRDRSQYINDIMNHNTVILEIV